MADLVKELGGKVDTGNNDENKIKEG